MDSILIPWKQGKGNIVVNNDGGSVTIASDVINDHIDRTQQIEFRTTKGDAAQIVTVNQIGMREVLRDNVPVMLRDSEGNVLTALK